MKRHTFKAIRWLGEPTDQRRYAVVEVDQAGPVLRGGPYRSPVDAEATVKSLGRTLRRDFSGQRNRGETP